MVMAYDNAQRRHDGTITFCCASKQFLKFEEPELVRCNNTPSIRHAHWEPHVVRFPSEMSVGSFADVASGPSPRAITLVAMVIRAARLASILLPIARGLRRAKGPPGF